MIKYKEEMELFAQEMDRLGLPFFPEQGEEVHHYRQRLLDYFGDNMQDLPPPFCGNLFNFVSEYEFGQYLEKHYNIAMQEDVRYTLWRK